MIVRPELTADRPLPDWASTDAAQLRRLANYEPMTGVVVLPDAFDDLPH